MNEVLTGTVQAGYGDASRWLGLFNSAYARKLQMAVYPGSLNLALDTPFDWSAPRYERHIVWFGRAEYGGERDILLLPCDLVSLGRRRAYLWTPTTAVHMRTRPEVVEVVCDVRLRDAYSLTDGDVVTIELPVEAPSGDS